MRGPRGGDGAGDLVVADHVGDVVEQALTGTEWNANGIARAVQALTRDFRPLTDMRASQHYRGRVASNLLHRLHADTVQNAEPTSVWNYVG